MEKIVFFVGESGAGKTFAQEKIIKAYPHQYCRVLSTTTRLPREGEKEGLHYEFITEDEFKVAKNKGSFLQSVNFGNLNYGTRKSEYIRKTPIGIFVCTPEGILDTVNSLKDCHIKFHYEITFFNPSSKKLKKHGVAKERSSRVSIKDTIKDIMEKSLNQGLYKDFLIRILNDNMINEHVHKYAV